MSASQQNSLEALLDIARERNDPKLLADLQCWITLNIVRPTQILELEKPAALYTYRESVALRRRMATSWAQGMVAMQPEAFIEGKDNSLVMSVFLIRPTERSQTPQERKQLEATPLELT